MIKIAVTGVIGSGKTTISKIFKEMGYDVIDADEISRNLTKKGSPVYEKILKEFGKEILKGNGEINRKALADIVFKDKKKKEILEGIIHPEVKKFCIDRANELEKAGKDILVLDIPLLFEAGMEDMVDYVILAYADEDTLYERVKKRDGLTKEEFFSRLKNQIPLDEKIKKSHFVVDTRKDIEEIRLELGTIIKKLHAITKQ